MKSLPKLALLPVLLAWSLSAQAAPVVAAERSPNLGTDLGILASQSAVPIWLESVSPTVGGRLTEIVWWGYFFPDASQGETLPADQDVAFNVLVGGQSQVGTLSFSPVADEDIDDVDLIRYSLILAGGPQLKANSVYELGIENVNLESRWYWQGSGSGNEDLASYQLTVNTPDGSVPEPSAWLLGGLAMLAAGVARRRAA